ncbi:MAG: carboxypeptidase-like regulatory domain-containing protein [Planctomycetaceae bacterium]|nr:carboxypeptidase-like regulatory domain-containing protein [Planctomycetaceae bacterium]
MRALLVIGCLTAPLAIGCGGGSSGDMNYAGVNGVVTLDGKPVGGATVAFAPKGKGSMSMGLTDAGGRFELKSATGKTGAAVGDHDVTVSLSMTVGGPAVESKADDLAPPLEGASADDARASGPQTRWIVPEKYSKPGALQASVPSAGLSGHKLDLVSK